MVDNDIDVRNEGEQSVKGHAEVSGWKTWMNGYHLLRWEHMEEEYLS